MVLIDNSMRQTEIYPLLYGKVWQCSEKVEDTAILVIVNTDSLVSEHYVENPLFVGRFVYIVHKFFCRQRKFAPVTMRETVIDVIA